MPVVTAFWTVTGVADPAEWAPRHHSVANLAAPQPAENSIL
jgi:hypothetical protein